MQSHTMEYLDQFVVLRVITGSVSQGTNLEGSDVDIKACVRLPNKDLLILSDPWETELFTQPDIEYHSLRKLINLLTKQNPTALELLNVEDRFVLYQNDIGLALRENRHLFISKKCYESYCGYAREQFIRIKKALDRTTDEDLCSYLKFVLERMIKNFDSKYSVAILNGIELVDVVISEETGTPVMKFNVDLKGIDIQKVHGMFSELHATYKNYKNVGWSDKTTSEKTLWKHASHLVRLLLTCKKLLQTGLVHVLLEEHIPLLLSIKQGEMSWDDVFSLVDRLNLELKEAYIVSTLPECVDREAIESLYTKLMMGE
jgi:hypothetical protein